MVQITKYIVIITFHSFSTEPVQTDLTQLNCPVLTLSMWVQSDFQPWLVQSPSDTKPQAKIPTKLVNYPVWSGFQKIVGP